MLNWSAHTAFFSNHESQNAKFFYKLKLSLKKNIVLVCNIWQLLQTGLFPLLEQVHDLVVTSVFSCLGDEKEREEEYEGVSSSCYSHSTREEEKQR